MATQTKVSTKEPTGTGTSDPTLIVGWLVVSLAIIGAVFIMLLVNGGSPAARKPATVSASEPNANSSVALHVGDTLAVTLLGNPSTGYTWDVASSDASILRPLGQALFTPDTSALGSGGRVTLQFGAVAAGQTALKLIYHRPFETGAAPLKTFELTVTVEK